MKALTILYDSRCGLCSRFRIWMEGQPVRARVEFLAYDSAEALRRFPALPEAGADRELVVLADDGRWWQGGAAWVMCLWVTQGYHEWAYRLSSPALLPFVRKVVRLISENRMGLSRLLGLRGDVELLAGIRSLSEPVCADGNCAVTHPPSLTS